MTQNSSSSVFAGGGEVRSSSISFGRRRFGGVPSGERGMGIDEEGVGEKICFFGGDFCVGS